MMSVYILELIPSITIEYHKIESPCRIYLKVNGANYLNTNNAELDFKYSSFYNTSMFGK
jgi:hypothetical protein